MPSPPLSSFTSLITPGGGGGGGGGSGFNSSTHLERLYEGPQESADALSSTEQFHQPHNSRGGGGGGGGSGFSSSTHLERLYEGPQESADALSSTEQFHEPHNSEQTEEVDTNNTRATL